MSVRDRKPVRSASAGIWGEIGRLKLVIAAVVISAAAVSLWQWQTTRKEEALARHDGWVAYLQGPLSDLLYGSSRLRPLLLKKRLSPADKAVAKEAAEHLRLSASRAQIYGDLFAKDPVMHPLKEAIVWHQEIDNLMGAWVNLVGRPLAQEALASEAEMRMRLWTLLVAQRERMLGEKTLNKDEVLEMNALLYSLQEDTKASR